MMFLARPCCEVAKVFGVFASMLWEVDRRLPSLDMSQVPPVGFFAFTEPLTDHVEIFPQ